VYAASKFRFTEHQNKFRTKRLGLAPVTAERLATGGKYLPTVYAFSRVLVRRPLDWPAWHRVSGFLLTPGAGADESLAPELDAFLARQPASASGGVCCVTFGSMASMEAAGCHVLQRSLAAALDAGMRVVIVAGWSGSAGPTRDALVPERHAHRAREDVLVVESAPHELLFPRCACVVHHGGAGTTARVASAGVPSVVVPILRWLDQAGWADALEQHGAAVHLRDPFCSRDELERAIRAVAVDWPSAVVYGARARSLARQLRAEELAGEGVRRAVRWLLSPLVSDGTAHGETMVRRNCLHRRAAAHAAPASARGAEAAEVW